MPVHLNGIDSSISSVRMCVSETINVLGLGLCLCGCRARRREEKNYDFEFFLSPYVTSSFLIYKYIKIKTEGVLSLNPFKFYSGFDLIYVNLIRMPTFIWEY